jgi:hypothetical protein
MATDKEEQEFLTAASHLLASVTGSMAGLTQSKPLARDIVDGLIIDTAVTSDLGCETAVMDEVGVHPVSRYATRKQAMVGHAWWCKNIVGKKEVVKLGWPGLIEDETIRLVRMR